jgi:hypothetical protein
MSTALMDAYDCLNIALVPHSLQLIKDSPSMLVATPVQLLRDYLQEQMAMAEDNEKELHIALSGGPRIMETVRDLEPIVRPHIHFYASAVIGRGRMVRNSHISPEVNATLAWERSGSIPGHLHYVTAGVPEIPTVPKSLKAEDYARERHDVAVRALINHAKQLASTDEVHQFLEDLSGVDILVAEITSVDGKAIPLTSGLLSSYGVKSELLKRDNAVGEINYTVFCNPSQPSAAFEEYDETRDLSMMFVAMGYPGSDGYCCRAVTLNDKKIIVIGGKEESLALRTSLEFRMFNVLVTDEKTAAAIMPYPPLPSRFYPSPSKPISNE